MTSLPKTQVATILKTLLYENLDSGSSDSKMLESQQLISKELQDCNQSLIECRQSTAQANSLGLFCKGEIQVNTKIGPYGGQSYRITEDLSKILGAEQTDYWEVYDVGENGEPDKLSGLLVGSSMVENWMQFVRYARNRKEQNLEVIQEGEKIVFQAVRDIKRDEELLVWFSDFYKLKFGVPSVYTVETGETKFEICNGPLPVPKGRKQSLLHGLFMPSEDGPKQKVWKCIRCTKTFISSGSLRAHARIHTGEKPYTCSFCQRSFCQMSTLRSHIRLHTGEKPFKCDVCHRSFTQSAGLRSHKKTHKSSSVEGVFLYSSVAVPK